jgi:hypothetical protein
MCMAVYLETQLIDFYPHQGQLRLHAFAKSEMQKAFNIQLLRKGYVPIRVNSMSYIPINSSIISTIKSFLPSYK